MGASIDEKVKVGEWVKPVSPVISHAKYINVTKKNVEQINENRNAYIPVTGDEVKAAEDYFEALKDIKVGDFILPLNGRLDKIAKVPVIEDPFEVESYSGAVDTERKEKRNWRFLFDCPDVKFSKEEAKLYFLKQRKRSLDEIKYFEKMLKALGVADFNSSI
jgi:hypothetical protein